LPPRLTANDTSLTVSAVVTNAGTVAGEEVVQLYVAHPDAGFRTPIRALAAFQRISLMPGETRTVSFTLSAKQLGAVDASGFRVLPPGSMWISVGGKQPGFRGGADAATTGVVEGVVAVGSR
jgi:beta-glucosidase